MSEVRPEIYVEVGQQQRKAVTELFRKFGETIETNVLISCWPLILGWTLLGLLRCAVSIAMFCGKYLLAEFSPSVFNELERRHIVSFRLQTLQSNVDILTR